MDFWRSIARKSTKEIIRSFKIINIQHSIITIKEETRVKCFGYLKRMGNERVPNMILEWNPKRRRRKKKPRE